MRATLTAATVLVLSATAACSSGGDTPDPSDSGEAEWNPTKPITFVVPFAPGGSTDPLSRIFASLLEPLLGTSINVENRPGAASAVGTAEIVNSKPDGYTIGLTGDVGLLVQPKVSGNVGYTGLENATPLVKLTSSPYLFVVPADSPWETLDDVINDAKSRMGEITVSTPGTFNPGDLVLTQFNAELDEREDVFRAVPFSDGGGEALAAVLGSHTQAGIAFVTTARAEIEAGNLRALAVFADEPLEAFPDVPTITSLGYTSTIGSNIYIIAPAGLPDNVFERLADASYQVVTSQEFIDFVAQAGSIHAPLNAEDARVDLQYISDSYASVFDLLEDRGLLPAG